MTKSSFKMGVRFIVPVPKILRLIGDESRRNGTDTLSSRHIDKIIRAVRTQIAAQRSAEIKGR